MQRVNDKAVVFLPWNTIEPEAQQQILNTATMPFVFKHVAVMPDCHYGKGATVGTVLATQGAVIPAAVGVDIGCGMIAVRTPLKRADIADAGGRPRRHRAAHPDERRQEQREAHRHCRRTRRRRSSAWPRRPAPRPTNTTRTGGWRSARWAAATTSSNWPRTATAPSG